MITPILEEIAKNATLREVVLNEAIPLNDREQILKTFLGTRLQGAYLGYDIRICEPEDACGLASYPEDASGGVYAEGRVISSALEIVETRGINPKKIKIFLWIKKS
jgi:hypothetical protein